MAGQHPEGTVSHPFALQGWRYMTFLHWRYPAEVVGRFLPDGFAPQLADGSAWVGLTPFLLADFRPLLLPAVPGLSTFPETNLRTYARGPDGRDTIWFFSLEAASLVTVLATRALLGVPYRWAAMAVERGDRVVYRSTRRPPHRPVGHYIEVEPGDRIPAEELSELDHVLTGRWRATATVTGRTTYVAVEHPPWPLHRATVHRLDEDLLAEAGLPLPAGEPLVHYSPGVDVRLGWQPLRTTPSH